MPVQTVPAMRMRMMRRINEYIGGGEYVWQTHCGVRGPYSKYQEEYRVLGNQNRTEVAAHLFSPFRDRSYEANARAVSRVLIGLHE